MKEIAFIACYNNDFLMQECKRYIERLFVPEGYRIDIITVAEAPSMCAGYNAAMNSSNAEIKIYLHQDTFVVNRYLLFNLIDIFGSDSTIGIIGLAGTDALPKSAVWWRGEIKGRFPFTTEEYFDERIDKESEFTEAVVVDGFFIASSKDIEWREDIFDGFDFYDISQCMEFRRKGFKVIAAEQSLPWCVHADGFFLDFAQYSKTREIFMEEYNKNEFVLNDEKEVPTDFDDFEEELKAFDQKKDMYENFQKEFEKKVSNVLLMGNYENLMNIYLESLNFFSDNKMMVNNIDADYLRFMVIMDAYQKEVERGEKLFVYNTKSTKELLDKFRKTEVYLRRLEFEFDNKEAYEETFQFIRDEEISKSSLEEIMNSAVAQLGNIGKIRDRLWNKEGCVYV